METRYDLREALTYINPAETSYNEWLSVGMALKDAGYPVSVWEDWSRRDPARFHPGECLRKWESFKGSVVPVTAGTIVQAARSRGWQTAPPPIAGGGSSTGHELGWDDLIGLGNRDPMGVVDMNWLQGREVPEPADWSPSRQLIEYLRVLFRDTDYVGYCTRSFEKDGRFCPTKGCFDRTAGELIEKLTACGDDIGKVFGDWNPEAGAWIRFNPLDGKDCRDENVTAYRYALLESDELPIETQNALLRELELPIAALVHSGDKSLHAIVRIDAADGKEYRRRVDYLYEVCRKNGLKPDKNNRNPSRLSRMPGVTRAGKKQFLVDTNIGKGSWEEWREWIESVNDDLPDPEDELQTDLPPLAPALIENVLRQGHKMLLAGPSKAGKSYALIELAVCIAEGVPWLGFPCACGKVLYVNLELDRASCLHRFRDVRQAMRAPSRRSVDIWNLRGHSIPMDQLAPKLIRRCLKKNYLAVIIDPIYKVLTGDENSADQMARFCNQFDKVCTELGCAVIYCHHHSKGSQGSKRSMDRASGSGVFARDPDALLDLIELPVTEALQKQEANNAACQACAATLKQAGKLDEASWDALCSENAALSACKALLSPREYDALQEAVKAAKRAAESRTAWRIEGTLREFPKFPAVNLWFDYPVHRLDDSGALGDVTPDGDAPVWQRPKKEKKPKNKKKERMDALENAIAVCNLDEAENVSIQAVMDYTGKTKATIKNWVEEHPGYTIQGSMIIKKSKEDTA